MQNPPGVHTLVYPPSPRRARPYMRGNPDLRPPCCTRVRLSGVPLDGACCVHSYQNRQTRGIFSDEGLAGPAQRPPEHDTAASIAVAITATIATASSNTRIVIVIIGAGAAGGGAGPDGA